MSLRTRNDGYLARAKEVGRCWFRSRAIESIHRREKEKEKEKVEENENGKNIEKETVGTLLILTTSRSVRNK